jgi:peptide chain release factor 2
MILGGYFDVPKKEEQIKELESDLNNPDIWNNPTKANELNMKLANVKKEISEYNRINEELSLIDEILSTNDIDLLNESVNDIDSLEESINSLEIKSLLSGEFDEDNCYLEIHPGAGGTEAHDWANMLLRMYQMYFEKNGFKYTIIDKQPGEEAGIKSVMIKVEGDHPYGYLKSEIGVHRLVRISPFNAAGKRQTSFAAVNVTPEIAEVPKDIEIKEEDIRIDITRASGNGGQGVNTTDSAVRLTHLPTGIVIYSQNERSQLRNKETAMDILKSKLYQLEIQKRKDEINNLKGSDDINFGSQIRNYVLEPYKLVKDVRTGYETSQVDKVLDGDIGGFIDSYLRM